MSDPGSDQGSSLRWVLHVMAAGCIGLGLVGMVVSFRFMSFPDSADRSAGNTGFIAGSILIGSGLIALAILARREQK